MKLLRDYETVLRKINQHPEDSRLEKELIALTQKMENMGAWTIETEAKSVLTRLGISDFYQNVETLSGGQRKRVALAGALITPSDLLILDEPTNHIDSETVDWLEKYLAKRTGALLMVTHDRYFLDRVVNRILEIDRGFLYSYQANYEKYLEMKLEREEIAQASERKRQDLIRNELKWIQRGARARTTKQKARLGRFEKLTEQEGLRESENIDIQAAISRLGKKIIHLENISKRFPCGEIIRDFSYSFLKDDRVGIIGPNGSGKSTLLKIMTGQISPDNGSVSIGQTVKTGFFSQENDDMDEGLRVIEYIRKKAEYINTRDGTISASQMLERFLFPPNVQWTPIAKLSGGEKRRLYLLYILMGAPNVLMLDEPTNDLDIQTLTVLENYLDDFPGVVIVVSHDRYFLDRVADKIFSFEGNGEVRQYAGNYTDYRQYAEQLQQSAADQSRETEKQNRNEKREVKKDRPLKFTYREQKEFEQIDGIIEALEKKLQRITLEMNDASSDFQKLQQLVAEKDGVEKQLEDAIERWTYLNELYEKIEGR